MAVKSYRDLVAWQKAMDMVEAVYRATKRFPQEEMYALTSQLRRAAVSVPSNIAEGQGRKSRKEFTRFLRIARGSLQETETQIMIATRLGYIKDSTQATLLNQCTEIARLLNGLTSSLHRD